MFRSVCRMNTGWQLIYYHAENLITYLCWWWHNCFPLCCSALEYCINSHITWIRGAVNSYSKQFWKVMLKYYLPVQRDSLLFSPIFLSSDPCLPCSVQILHHSWGEWWKKSLCSSAFWRELYRTRQILGLFLDITQICLVTTFPTKLNACLYKFMFDVCHVLFTIVIASNIRSAWKSMHKSKMKEKMMGKHNSVNLSLRTHTFLM